MRRRCLLCLPLPLLVAVLACSSTDNSLLRLAPGELLLSPNGSAQSASGLVQLVDQNGNPAPLPASGCAVVIGANTLCAGTNRQGLFEILGLPLQALQYWLGVIGFLPQIGTLPQGTTSLPPGTLRLQPDPDPNDNPRFLDLPEPPRINVGTDGIPRLVGYLPDDGAELKVFMSRGSNPGTFDGAAGVALDTLFGSVGQNRFFQTMLPQTFETGALYACLFSANGFDFMSMYGCDLTINVTPRAGTRQGVAGTITMPDGFTGSGLPEVTAWEDGNFGNRIGGGGADWTALTGAGGFEGTLPAAPAAGTVLNVVVRWKDSTGGLHACAKQFP